FSPPDDDPPEETPPEILPRTSPENVIKNLQAIYNDKVRNAIDRRTLSEQQRPPADTDPQSGQAFIFNFQPADIAAGLPPSWGQDSEVQAHKAIFEAQESGDIYSLELRITHGTPTILTELGHEGWKEIFASNVYLRLMFNLEDGLEVNGGQAEFKFAPGIPTGTGTDS